jgi:diadenosine tetraphosphate (Ap4A) HIT family hydrolase
VQRPAVVHHVIARRGATNLGIVLERLWNGWRSNYVQSVGSDGGDDDDGRSVFTRILSSGLSDEDANIVHRGPLCFAILNAFPYATGHVLVLPYREVADLESLTVDETAELWATTTNAVRALKAAYQPEGLNVGINLGRPAGGSISEHLHVHVLPRWTGDVNFMTAVANTRTLPEALTDTARKVRNAWPSQDK